MLIPEGFTWIQVYAHWFLIIQLVRIGYEFLNVYPYGFSKVFIQMVKCAITLPFVGALIGWW